MFGTYEHLVNYEDWGKGVLRSHPDRQLDIQ